MVIKFNLPDPFHLIGEGFGKLNDNFCGKDIEIGINVGTDTAYLLRSHEHFQETYRLQKEKIEQLKPTYRIPNLMELLEVVRS